MTSTNDLEIRTLATSRVLDFTPEKIFAAMADPARLARWWGPNGFTNTFHEFDFRTGGVWKYTMHGSNGGNYPNESLFAEVVPNQTVVIRHTSSPHYTLTITLEEIDGKTKLGWRQSFDTVDMCNRVREVCVPANEQNLDRLAAELARS
jgi:uncharacterized protein YndB with AHSA1/START domain